MERSDQDQEILENVENSTFTTQESSESSEVDIVQIGGQDTIDTIDENENNLITFITVKQDRIYRKYGGIIFGLLASLFFSLTVVLAKLLCTNHNYHPFTISFFRYLGIFLPSIPILIVYHFCMPRVTVFETVWPLNSKEKDKWINLLGLFFRGLLGCSSVILRFCSLKYLTVADSAVISYSGPIFVTILANFCLKNEKCTILSIFCSILTFLGIIIISRPAIGQNILGYDTDILIGCSLAFGSMICASCVFIVMRKIRQVHFSLMTLIFGMIGVVESGVLAFSTGVFEIPSNTQDILYTAALAVLTFFGQISIIFAIKFENAGPVSLIRTSDVLLSFIWQFIILSVIPDLYSCIGASIIIICVLLTAFRKWISTLDEDHPQRQLFWFILK